MKRYPGAHLVHTVYGSLILGGAGCHTGKIPQGCPVGKAGGKEVRRPANNQLRSEPSSQCVLQMRQPMLTA